MPNKIQLIDEYCDNAPFECHQDLDEKLSAHFDHVLHTTFPYYVSPRFFYQSGLKFTMRDTWWYIDKLYKSNPSSIIDIGCGECEWKRFLPNITGVDNINNPWTFCDIFSNIDDDFFKENQNKYDCGINLNAFFGHSNDWDAQAPHIHSVMSLVKHSALFTIPFRSIQNIPTEIQSDYSSIVKAFIDIIYNLGYEVLLLDLPTHRIDNPSPIIWNYHSRYNVSGPNYVNQIRFILKHPDSDYRKKA